MLWIFSVFLVAKQKNESRKVLYVVQAVHFTHISGMFTSKV